LHHKEIKAAQGVKIAAQNLESAVAGTQMLVAGPNDDVEVLKAEVMEDMKDIFGSVDRSGHHLLPRSCCSIDSMVTYDDLCTRHCQTLKSPLASCCLHPNGVDVHAEVVVLIHMFQSRMGLDQMQLRPFSTSSHGR